MKEHFSQNTPRCDIGTYSIGLFTCKLDAKKRHIGLTSMLSKAVFIIEKVEVQRSDLYLFGNYLLSFGFVHDFYTKTAQELDNRWSSKANLGLLKIEAMGCSV